ncbi:carbohydrate-binding domain-containing protein [Vibrio ziniensis]|uniref:Carbohydrate-binding domain-containing protein n=1 Tax=Vibrio ziniensis TaxID=2711221 RepID=A0A6G7CNQ7_9VIBR|nr:carbohydrate-binding domain-containing protein [Vibrio ziniensis]QIH43771.1 carbohydrate-binding domain-containing protein [Vibrio ziniensis]
MNKRPLVMLACWMLVSFGSLQGCQSEDVSSSSNTSDSVDSSSDNSSVWDIDTGAYSTDSIDGLSYQVINIYLDSLDIDNKSTLLDLTTSEGISSFSFDGATVITVSEDDYGITIDSSLTDDQLGDGILVEYAIYTGSDFTKTLTIYSEGDFKLSLNGVTISSTDGPAINIQSSQRAFIELVDGTQNFLSDTSTWSDRYLTDGSDMDLKATFFSEGQLIFSGAGSLDVTAAKKHAICSDDYVRITDGTLYLTAEKKDGIRANDAFILDDGELTITTALGKGIKVEGKEDDTDPIGFIAINNGTLTIESYDKAITASWEGDEDGDTTTTDDDPDPRVTVNGGTITIVTTGTPSDDLSPEGIEAKSILTINGGSISVQTTDDALNAGNSIVINDGYLYAVSSDNDAIDSNGTLAINGGVIVAGGATSPEGAFDSDNNTFAITGGIFVGYGGSSSSPTASATTQNTLSLSRISSGLLAITDSSGNPVFAFTMPESATAVLLGTPNLETGKTYSLYNGGSIGSYSDLYNGLYIDPDSYTLGSRVSNFSISSTVTTVRDR